MQNKISWKLLTRERKSSLKSNARRVFRKRGVCIPKARATRQRERSRWPSGQHTVEINGNRAIYRVPINRRTTKTLDVEYRGGAARNNGTKASFVRSIEKSFQIHRRCIAKAGKIETRFLRDSVPRWEYRLWPVYRERRQTFDRCQFNFLRFIVARLLANYPDFIGLPRTRCPRKRKFHGGLI